ncbi:hypothetical protein EOA24_33990 [Mesorhizobium sp. M2A.F.Ca.ET.039.01.1.1]|nr:hypothetical protein EOA24_33990 [Mesorhizobium sp. M2A.F.Ca.ET.039.01.1.1]
MWVSAGAQQRLHAVGAKPAAVHVRKKSRCASLPGLLEPEPEGLLCDLGERRTSRLPALANASHRLRARAECASAVSVLSAWNGLPRKSGANCKPTIC